MNTESGRDKGPTRERDRRRGRERGNHESRNQRGIEVDDNGTPKGRKHTYRGRRGGRGMFRNGQSDQSNEEEDDSYVPRGRGKSTRGGRGYRGRGGSVRNDERTKHWRKVFGFTRLTEYQNGEASDLVLKFVSEQQLLKEVLQCDDHSDEMVELLLKCLSKACCYSILKQHVQQILIILQASTFFKMTILQLILKITKLPVSELDKYEASLISIINLIKEMKSKMPNTMFEVIGITTVLEKVVSRVSACSTLQSAEIVAAFKRLELSNEEEMQEMSYEKDHSHKRTFRPDEEDQEPPENFHEIPVFPEEHDILVNMNPFLRMNKRCGGYQDLNHYLDVQFRLLREDFIGPLRDGIQQYIALLKGTNNGDKKSKMPKDIRVYTDVQVISSVCNSSGLCRRISFSCPGFKRIHWESSKRLLFGSLVCLSNDDFDTLYFATVGNRDFKNLRKGLVDIKFEDDSNTMACLPENAIFKMAESSAFFEAYRHVLSGLKTLLNGDLPFEKYIVHSKANVDEPAYIRRNPHAMFDLRPLVDDDVVLVEKTKENIRSRWNGYNFSPESAQARNVPVMNYDQWPSADALHLNESQYSAVQMALSKEFAIIQGPPGTGKTYIGKKIVKALLHNKDIWSPNVDENKLLLVVCYTNHALDQFLEGIDEFYKGGILRLGSRSSSDVMKRHNINTKRLELRRNRRAPTALHRERVKARVKRNTLKIQINAIADKIEKAKRDVLHEDTLQPFIGTQLRFQLTRGCNLLINEMKAHGIYPSRGFEMCAILEWLGYGNLTCGKQTLHLPTTNYDPEEDDDDDYNDDEYIDAEDEVDREMLNRIPDIYDERNEEIDKNAAVLEISKLFAALGLSNDRVALDVSSIGSKRSYTSGEWQMDAKQRKRLKKTIRYELASSDRMSMRDVYRIQNIWTLKQKDRWRLYRFWIFLYCQTLQEQIRDAEKVFQDACDLVNEIQLHEDKEIMKRSTVIGMTTTCAARYQSVLKEIGPKIVIVEEAAEVLEAHVLTTLSKYCEHLILIGDHQQLKPSPTVYKLAKNYNLDLSLFERLINNKMDFRCLALQHRMRPEISTIMKIIYPKLQDHNSVKKYPSIKGVSTNVFLIDHSEQETSDEDIVSHSNTHEAEFIVALCRYLLLQGYKCHQITVLTLYSAQLRELKNRMPKKYFDGLRLTVVDNYQGEENDIVLLSLVRSNTNRISGFVSIENRICVAFSRAKLGLFIIGNFRMLERAKDRKSDLWKKIVSLAEDKNMIGPNLLLKCQNHPMDEGIGASSAADFRKAPEGGCMKPCEALLNCGHACTKACHVYDKKHKEYTCMKPCERQVCGIKGHKCTRTCGKKCEQCMIKIPKVIPGCYHEQDVPCSQDPSTWKCMAQCRRILSCGHPCQSKCSEPHTIQCQFDVKKTAPCGHFIKVRCFETFTAICSKSCDAFLDCGHPCTGTCGECFSGKLHRPCRQKCKRTLVCEHECSDNCSNCPPCSRICQNRCIHSVCQKHCGEICILCIEQCEWRCKHFVCNKLCYEPCERPRCNNPCLKQLPCGHDCIGLCGEMCPRVCRVCDKEKVKEILFGTEDDDDARFVQLEDCKHFFEVGGLDQWMDQPVESDERKVSIKLKECPLCKTPIRRNLRYGNMIKSTLRDIEKVKKQIQGGRQNITAIRLSIERDIQRFGTEDQKAISEIYSRKRQNGLSSVQSYETVKNQLLFLQKLQDLKRQLKHRHLEITPCRMFQMTNQAVSNLRYFIVQERNYFTDQEIADIMEEIDRLTFLLQYCELEKYIERTTFKFVKHKAATYDMTKDWLTKDRRLSETEKTCIKQFLKSMKHLIKKDGLGITDKEREEIVRAMELSKGHWFKCPSGHVYAIGECGGATVESRCPECNATIGGASHRLREDNALASEMDGATHAAWSEQAYMENYDPFEIRF